MQCKYLSVCPSLMLIWILCIGGIVANVCIYISVTDLNYSMGLHDFNWTYSSFMSLHKSCSVATQKVANNDNKKFFFFFF